jgi:hypothetical protein
VSPADKGLLQLDNDGALMLGDLPLLVDELRTEMDALPWRRCCMMIYKFLGNRKCVQNFQE